MAVATGNLKFPRRLHRTVTRTLSLLLGAIMPEIRSPRVLPYHRSGFFLRLDVEPRLEF